MSEVVPLIQAAIEPVPFARIQIGDEHVALLRDGGQVYSSMLEAISKAQSTICLETYILAEDGTGHRFAKALSERARAGVEVNLVYDAWGSSVSEGFLDRLRRAGIRVLAFNPIRFSGRMAFWFAHVRRRDHRKILVIDGKIGFTGGLNVSDDYAAPEDGGRGWRDTHVRIEGEAAALLQQLFLKTWRRNRGPRLSDERYPPPPVRSNRRVKILGNDFSLGRKAISRAYVEAIRHSKRRVHLTQAYFLPPVKVIKQLQRAAKRGVDVTLILAATTDVVSVFLAARGLYGKLLRSGIRVFEWRGRVLHAKTAVVDGRWATVGSSNLDPLSLRVNLEVNAVFEDETFGSAAEAMFTQDLYHCQEIRLDEWMQRPMLERFLSWVAYRFRHWL